MREALEMSRYRLLNFANLEEVMRRSCVRDAQH
jgi:hypothetical protein